jgi:hypothetical protein
MKLSNETILNAVRTKNDARPVHLQMMEGELVVREMHRLEGQSRRYAVLLPKERLVVATVILWADEQVEARFAGWFARVPD